MAIHLSDPPHQEFKIGELVRVHFTGEIEGVQVKVHRDVFVRGVTVLDGGGVRYQLAENWGPSSGAFWGRGWASIDPKSMEHVEPVVAAIKRANEGVAVP